MKYFIRINQWHYPKNKLEEAFLEFAKTIQFHTCETAEDFSRLLKDTLMTMNNNHKRCSPLKFLEIQVEESYSYPVGFRVQDQPRLFLIQLELIEIKGSLDESKEQVPFGLFGNN